MGLSLRLYGYIALTTEAKAEGSPTGWQAAHIRTISDFAGKLQDSHCRGAFQKAIGYQDPEKLNSEWLHSIRVETDLIRRPVLNALVDEVYDEVGTILVPHINHICADSPGAFTAADDIADRCIAVVDISKVEFRQCSFDDFRYIVKQAVEIQQTIRRKMTGFARTYDERPSLAQYDRLMAE